MLRLSPAEFWQLTTHELYDIIEALEDPEDERPIFTRDDLDRLLREYA